MRISQQEVLARANELYAAAKDEKRPDCDMTHRQIQSDQVKAISQALVEAINTQLSHQVSFTDPDTGEVLS